MVFPIQEIIFYAFAAVLIFSASMVVISQNAVRAALFLVLAFFASAGLWLLVQAEFLALILVLVYVGAVMTLFLFVVMTLNLHPPVDRYRLLRYAPLGLLVVAMMVAFVMYVTGTNFQTLAPLVQNVGENNTLALGSVLYTEYFYPFEVAGVLLLVAIIAAICLTAPVKRNRKVQNPADQIAVKSKDRLQIIEMPSETKIPKGNLT